MAKDTLGTLLAELSALLASLKSVDDVKKNLSKLRRSVKSLYGELSSWEQSIDLKVFTKFTKVVVESAAALSTLGSVEVKGLTKTVKTILSAIKKLNSSQIVNTLNDVSAGFKALKVRDINKVIKSLTALSKFAEIGAIDIAPLRQFIRDLEQLSKIDMNNFKQNIGILKTVLESLSKVTLKVGNAFNNLGKESNVAKGFAEMSAMSKQARADISKLDQTAEQVNIEEDLNFISAANGVNTFEQNLNSLIGTVDKAAVSLSALMDRNKKMFVEMHENWRLFEETIDENERTGIKTVKLFGATALRDLDVTHGIDFSKSLEKTIKDLTSVDVEVRSLQEDYSTFIHSLIAVRDAMGDTAHLDTAINKLQQYDKMIKGLLSRMYRVRNNLTEFLNPETLKSKALETTIHNLTVQLADLKATLDDEGASAKAKMAAAMEAEDIEKRLVDLKLLKTAMEEMKLYIDNYVGALENLSAGTDLSVKKSLEYIKTLHAQNKAFENIKQQIKSVEVRYNELAGVEVDIFKQFKDVPLTQDSLKGFMENLKNVRSDINGINKTLSSFQINIEKVIADFRNLGDRLGGTALGSSIQKTLETEILPFYDKIVAAKKKATERLQTIDMSYKLGDKISRQLSKYDTTIARIAGEPITESNIDQLKLYQNILSDMVGVVKKFAQEEATLSQTIRSTDIGAFAKQQKDVESRLKSIIKEIKSATDNFNKYALAIRQLAIQYEDTPLGQQFVNIAQQMTQYDEQLRAIDARSQNYLNTLKMMAEGVKQYKGALKAVNSVSEKFTKVIPKMSLASQIVEGGNYEAVAGFGVKQFNDIINGLQTIEQLFGKLNFARQIVAQIRNEFQQAGLSVLEFDKLLMRVDNEVAKLGSYVANIETLLANVAPSLPSDSIKNMVKSLGELKSKVELAHLATTNASKNIRIDFDTMSKSMKDAAQAGQEVAASLDTIRMSAGASGASGGGAGSGGGGERGGGVGGSVGDIKEMLEGLFILDEEIINLYKRATPPTALINALAAVRDYADKLAKGMRFLQDNSEEFGNTSVVSFEALAKAAKLSSSEISNLARSYNVILDRLEKLRSLVQAEVDQGVMAGADVSVGLARLDYIGKLINKVNQLRDTLAQSRIDLNTMTNQLAKIDSKYNDFANTLQSLRTALQGIKIKDILTGADIDFALEDVGRVVSQFIGLDTKTFNQQIKIIEERLNIYKRQVVSKISAIKNEINSVMQSETLSVTVKEETIKRLERMKTEYELLNFRIEQQASVLKLSASQIKEINKLTETWSDKERNIVYYVRKVQDEFQKVRDVAGKLALGEIEFESMGDAVKYVDMLQNKFKTVDSTVTRLNTLINDLNKRIAVAVDKYGGEDKMPQYLQDRVNKMRQFVEQVESLAKAYNNERYEYKTTLNEYKKAAKFIDKFLTDLQTYQVNSQTIITQYADVDTLVGMKVSQITDLKNNFKKLYDTFEAVGRKYKQLSEMQWQPFGNMPQLQRIQDVAVNIVQGIQEQFNILGAALRDALSLDKVPNASKISGILDELKAKIIEEQELANTSVTKNLESPLKQARQIITQTDKELQNIFSDVNKMQQAFVQLEKVTPDELLRFVTDLHQESARTGQLMLKYFNEVNNAVNNLKKHVPVLQEELGRSYMEGHIKAAEILERKYKEVADTLFKLKTIYQDQVTTQKTASTTMTNQLQKVATKLRTIISYYDRVKDFNVRIAGETLAFFKNNQFMSIEQAMRAIDKFAKHMVNSTMAFVDESDAYNEIYKMIQTRLTEIRTNLKHIQDLQKTLTTDTSIDADVKKRMLITVKDLSDKLREQEQIYTQIRNAHKAKIDLLKHEVKLAERINELRQMANTQSTSKYFITTGGQEGAKTYEPLNLSASNLILKDVDSLVKLAATRLRALKLAKEHAAAISQEAAMVKSDSIAFEAMGDSVAKASSNLSSAKKNVELLGVELRLLFNELSKAEKEVELLSKGGPRKRDIQSALNSAKLYLFTIQDAMQKVYTGSSQILGAIKRQSDAYKKLTRNSRDFSLEVANGMKMQLKYMASFGLIYGTTGRIREVFGEIVKEHEQLSRALVVSRSDFQDLNERLVELENTMDRIRVKFGLTAEIIGTSLYQLGSAGLTLGETKAAIEPVMNLVVATGAKVNDITKMLATTFNILTQQSQMSGNAMSDFKRIADTIAVTFRDNQVEIDEFINALKFTIPLAHQVGMSFEELNAIIGTLGTQGIKGGLAGRQLRTMFFKIIANRKKFEEAFADIGLSIDPTAAIDFLDIVQQTGRALKDNVITASKMNAILKSLGIRATGPFITLAQSIDLLNKNLDTVNNNSRGVAEAMASIRLNELNKQIDIMRQNIYLLYKSALKYVIKGLQIALQVFNKFANAIRLFNEGTGGLLSSLGGITTALLTFMMTIRLAGALVSTFRGIIMYMIDGLKLKDLMQIATSSKLIAVLTAEAAAHDLNAMAIANETKIKGSAIAATEALAAEELRFMNINIIASSMWKKTSGIIIGALNKVKGAFSIMGKAIGAHPIVAAALAAGAALGAMYAWYKYTYDLTKANERLAESINEINKAQQERANRIISLHNQYNELINTYKRLYELQDKINSESLMYDERNRALAEHQKILEQLLESGKTFNYVMVDSNGILQVDMAAMRQSIMLAKHREELEREIASRQKAQDAKKALSSIKDELTAYAYNYKHMLYLKKQLDGLDIKALLTAEKQNRATGGMVEKYHELQQIMNKIQPARTNIMKAISVLIGTDKYQEALNLIKAIDSELYAMLEHKKMILEDINIMPVIDIYWKVYDEATKYKTAVDDIVIANKDLIKSLDDIAIAVDENDMGNLLAQLLTKDTTGKFTTALSSIITESMTAYEQHLQFMFDRATQMGNEEIASIIKYRIYNFRKYSQELIKAMSAASGQDLAKIIVKSYKYLDVFNYRMKQLGEHEPVIKKLFGNFKVLNIRIGDTLVSTNMLKDNFVDMVRVMLNTIDAVQAYDKVMDNLSRATWGRIPTLSKELSLLRSRQKVLKQELDDLGAMNAWIGTYIARTKDAQEALKTITDKMAKSGLSDEAQQAAKKRLEEVFQIRKQITDTTHEIWAILYKHATTMVRLNVQQAEAVAGIISNYDQLAYKLAKADLEFKLLARDMKVEDMRGMRSEMAREELLKRQIDLIKLRRDLYKAERKLFNDWQAALSKLIGAMYPNTVLSYFTDIALVYNKFVELGQEAALVEQQRADAIRMLHEYSLRMKSVMDKSIDGQRNILLLQRQLRKAKGDLIEIDTRRLNVIAEFYSKYRNMLGLYMKMFDLQKQFLAIQKSAYEGISSINKEMLDQYGQSFKTIGEHVADLNIFDFAIKAARALGDFNVVTLDAAEIVDRLLNALKFGIISYDTLQREFGGAFAKMGVHVKDLTAKLDTLHEMQLSVVQDMFNIDYAKVKRMLSMDKVGRFELEQIRTLLQGMKGYADQVSKFNPEEAERMYLNIGQLARSFADLAKQADEQILLSVGLNADKFFDTLKAMDAAMQKWLLKYNRQFSIDLVFRVSDKGVAIDLQNILRKVQPASPVPNEFVNPIYKAQGGLVPGVGDTDSVPAMLTPGEFVIPKDVVQKIGIENLYELIRDYGGAVRQLRRNEISYFEYLNRVEDLKDVLGFNKGGLVGGVQYLAGGGEVRAAKTPLTISSSIMIDKLSIDPAIHRSIVSLGDALGGDFADAMTDGFGKRNFERQIINITRKAISPTMYKLFVALRKKFNASLQKWATEEYPLIVNIAAGLGLEFGNAFANAASTTLQSLGSILSTILDTSWISLDELAKKDVNAAAKSFEDGYAQLVKQLRRNEISYFEYLNRLEDLQADFAKQNQPDTNGEFKDYGPERIRAVLDSMYSGGVAIIQGFLDPLEQVFTKALQNAAKNAVDNLLTLASLFGDMITAAFENVDLSNLKLSDVTDAFAKIGSVIGDYVASGINNLESFGEDLASNITRITDALGINLDVIADKFNWLGGILAKAGDKIQDGLAIVGDALGAAGSWLGDKLAVFGDTVSNVVGGLVGIADTITGPVIGAISSFGPAMEGAVGAVVVFGGIMAAVGAALGSLSLDKVTTFFEGATTENGDKMPSIYETIQGVVDHFIKSAPKIIDKIIEHLPRLIKALSDAAADIVPQLGKLASKFIDALVRQLPAIKDGLVKAVEELIKLMPTLVPKLMGMLGELVGSLMDVIGEAILPNIDIILLSLVDGALAFINAVIDHLPELLDAVIKAIPKIITALIRALPKIIKALIRAVPIIVEALLSGIVVLIAEIVKTFFSAWLPAIGQMIQEFGNWLWNKVKNSFLGRAVEGIWKAIKWIYNAILDLIDALDIFHVGGIVAHTGGALRPDERLAVLQIGEGVINKWAMQQIGEKNFHLLNNGIIPKAEVNLQQIISPTVAQPAKEQEYIGIDNRQEIKIEFNNCTFTGDADEIADSIDRKLAERFDNEYGILQNRIKGQFDNSIYR